MLKLAVKLKVELEMGTWRAETETSAVDLIAPHLEGIFRQVIMRSINPVHEHALDRQFLPSLGNY